MENILTLKYIKKHRLFTTKKGSDLKCERLFCILIDKNNHILEHKKIAQGTKNEIKYWSLDIEDFIFEPFESEKKLNNYKIIVIHNHPSSFSMPSKNDKISAKEDIILWDKISNYKKYKGLYVEIFYVIYTFDSLKVYDKIEIEKLNYK